MVPQPKYLFTRTPPSTRTITLTCSCRASLTARPPIIAPEYCDIDFTLLAFRSIAVLLPSIRRNAAVCALSCYRQRARQMAELATSLGNWFRRGRGRSLMLLRHHVGWPRPNVKSFASSFPFNWTTTNKPVRPPIIEAFRPVLARSFMLDREREGGGGEQLHPLGFIVPRQVKVLRL